MSAEKNNFLQMHNTILQGKITSECKMTKLKKIK